MQRRFGADLQASVLCSDVISAVVLPLQLLHDVSELFEGLKSLFGFLNGELGVLLLFPLRALVHRHAGTRICGQDTAVSFGQIVKSNTRLLSVQQV